MARSPYSPEQVKLQAVLREGRRQAGLSQAKLAEQLGRPQSFVAKYERGERRLEALEFIRILKALDMFRIETLDEIAAAIEDGEAAKPQEG